jgi:hypothetical protein
MGVLNFRSGKHVIGLGSRHGAALYTSVRLITHVRLQLAVDTA